MPDGTAYVDYANVHKYIYHPHSPNPADNKTWDAADPTSKSRWSLRKFRADGNNGFKGYTQDQLNTLPRVTTETGVTIGGGVTEEIQAANLVNIYLAQFKRGYAYTSVYILRDRTDEDGDQVYGFYRPDYTPRKAAVYLHNLTSSWPITITMLPPRPAASSIRSKASRRPRMICSCSAQTVRFNWSFGGRLTGEDRMTISFGATHSNVTIFDPAIGFEPVKTLPVSDL